MKNEKDIFVEDCNVRKKNNSLECEVGVLRGKLQVIESWLRLNEPVIKKKLDCYIELQGE